MADDGPVTPDELATLCRQFLTAEEEAALWRAFFAECLLVYGDKRGTLRDLLPKALARGVWVNPDGLKLAMLRAMTEHQRMRDPERRSGSFLIGKFTAHCDRKASAAWRQAYPEGRVVSMYLSLLDPLDCHLPEALRTNKNASPINKREAIERVQKHFGFPTFEACLRFLKRAGLKNLPRSY